jgi:predicted peroxiredoxin
MSEKETLIFVVTSAEEHPEKATIPFVLANAALAMDTEAIVILQTTGVYLGMKEYARHVHAAGFPPLQELMDAFQEGGGKLYVCDPCIKARQILPEDLIEGAQIVAGATLIDAFLDAKNVVVY